MNLGGYLVKRASREENFKELIKYHTEKISNTNDSNLISESHYWIGVAYNDYFKDNKKLIALRFPRICLIICSKKIETSSENYNFIFLPASRYFVAILNIALRNWNTYYT